MLNTNPVQVFVLKRAAGQPFGELETQLTLVVQDETVDALSTVLVVDILTVNVNIII